MLSPTLMTSARRHIGLPVIGTPDSQFELGVLAYDPDVPVFRQAYLFEQRLRQLAPNEESVLSGLPIADVTMTGATSPTSQITIYATPDDGPEAPIGAYVPTPLDLQSPEPLAAIAVGIANAINLASTPFVAAASAHNIPTGPSAAFATFTVQSIIPTAFSLRIVAVSLGAYVTQQGDMPKIQATFANPDFVGIAEVGEPTITVYGLLPILDTLESQIASASDNLSYDGAADVKFRADEIGQRVQLYRVYRRRLSSFFGISLNPLGSPNSARSGRGAVA